MGAGNGYRDAARRALALGETAIRQVKVRTHLVAEVFQSHGLGGKEEEMGSCPYAQPFSRLLTRHYPGLQEVICFPS